MKPSPERGGVSRPSISAWTTIRLHPALLGEARQRNQVVVMRVDPTVADEADEVQRGRPSVVAGLDQRRNPEEAPVLDRDSDAHEVLHHDPSGPKVEVSDLRVAHLTFRQAHGSSRRIEQRPGQRRIPQRAPRGRVREGDRIGVLLDAIPPAVENHEHYWYAGFVGHLCRTGDGM